MRTRVLAVLASTAVVAATFATTTTVEAAPAEAPKSYVVLMSELPAVAYRGGTPGYQRTKPSRGEKIDPAAPEVVAYVGHLQSTHARALRGARVDAGPVNTYTYALNGFSAMMTPTEAERMRLQKGVLDVQEDVLKQKQTDTSGDFLGLDGSGEAWETGHQGEGVIVGVIDTGIWPEHPSFADPGGLPRLRGPRNAIPCEFGDTRHNPDDLRFMCQNKLIGARDMRTTYKAVIGPEVYNSARDYDGHGTHTASTAAGNANVSAEIFGIDRGTVSGIAPRASVIAYSALGDLGGFGSDLADAIDQAVADGVDVINYSVGSSTPALDGPDDLAFLYAADAGVHVATSNGNAGPGAGTVGSPASVPWVTAVGASTHTRAFESTATLGNGSTYTGASLTEGISEQTTLIDAADRGNELCRPNVDFEPALAGEIVLCARGAIARVDKSKAVHEQGGAGMILFNENDAQALVTDNHFLPSVHISYSDGMAIREYIAATASTGKPGRPGKGKGKPGAEPPAPATASLSEGTKTTAQGSVMADFSSRGPVGAPASSDIIRPDVTAPGVNILAGNTPTPGTGRPGQLFQSISGTSMSSPHVAGLLALLDEAHPDWSPAVARSALMTTARQDVTKEDGSTPADPFDMGAGHVDPGMPTAAGSIFDPGLAFDVGWNDYLAFLCGSASHVVSPTTCAALEGAGYSPEASQLNLPSIGDSSVVASTEITRTVTNVSDKPLQVTADTEAPGGFEIDVEIEDPTLTVGESTSVTLTVNNLTSPADQWGFGSLTLNAGSYSTRSPIALRASSIGVAEAVTGVGASGTGSVEVKFGYTGDYAVNAFGLAAEELVAGTVAQDADQVFDPSDVESDGAVHYPLDLTDVKLYRLEMNQTDVTGDGTDLDIFVLGPGGDLVAASTSGGTNELVEIVDPAPGTYDLYVHGWGVGDTPVDFTFHGWTVDGTPEAPLEITGAPSAAVLGAVETVSYSWSGVEPGTTAVGVLEHTDGSEVLGVTQVHVTNTN